jgi:hypothetical protein
MRANSSPRAWRAVTVLNVDYWLSILPKSVRVPDSSPIPPRFVIGSCPRFSSIQLPESCNAPSLIAALPVRSDAANICEFNPNCRRAPNCSVNTLTERRHLDLERPSFCGIPFSASSVVNFRWLRTPHRQNQ